MRPKERDSFMLAKIKPEWITAIGTVILIVLTLVLIAQGPSLQWFRWPWFIMPTVIVVGLIVAAILNFKSAKLHQVPRQRQLESPPAHPVPAPIDTAIKEFDPKINVDFADDRDITVGQDNEVAYFVLVNRGRSYAYFVCLHPVRLKEHIITFSTMIPVIPCRESAYIYPIIKTHDGQQSTTQDLFYILWREYDALNNLNIHELSVAVLVTYQDDAKNLYETACELIFHPSEHLKVRERGQSGGSVVVDTRNPQTRKVAIAVSLLRRD